MSVHAFSNKIKNLFEYIIFEYKAVYQIKGTRFGYPDESSKNDLGKISTLPCTPEIIFRMKKQRTILG